MNGILLIDKPVGMTSHDVVYQVRKEIHEKRIGHTGTLDPLATGVLVLCVGTTTKLVKYFSEHDKTYLAEIAVGYATDTLDREGKITATDPVVSLTEAQADSVLQSFLGHSEQIPPEYSAIKVNGKKLYEYARKNQEMPEITPRPIEIMAIKRTTPVTVLNGVATFSFFVHCGKGTYIRSLCRDIGVGLDSCATLTALRRLSVGAFTIEEASPLTEVQNGKINLIDPIEKLGMNKLKVDAETTFRVKNGSFLAPERFASRQDTLLYDESDVLLAIYTFDETINMMRLSVLF